MALEAGQSGERGAEPRGSPSRHEDFTPHFKLPRSGRLMSLQRCCRVSGPWTEGPVRRDVVNVLLPG